MGNCTGNTTEANASQDSKALSTDTKAEEEDRSASSNDVHPWKAISNEVSPEQPLKSILLKAVQFWNAIVKSVKWAASSAAGITTSANTLKFLNMPYLESPCQQSDVPSTTFTALMSIFCNTVFSLVPNAGLSIRAIHNRLKALLSHVPVNVITVAFFNEEGMSEASTVNSVEGSGFKSSKFNWLQEASALNSTYCGWSSFNVTPESSTPSHISA